MQVFFEFGGDLDMSFFKDGLAQAGASIMNPTLPLMMKGVGPGGRRWRRNVAGNRETFQKLLDDAFSRPEPAASNTAFWACVRRAFPNALTDSYEREGALINIGLMYGAGSETTMNAIVFALTLLALDPAATAALVQVRPLLPCCRVCVCVCGYRAKGHCRGMVSAVERAAIAVYRSTGNVWQTTPKQCAVI